jgi:hypothetical protein
MPVEQPITLKEVQVRLGAPQHVLIHLCEKGVIEPDFAETSGRGKRREFSRRNLFEFGVALALRKFELPVATTALIVRVLRAFSRAVGKAVPGFELPEILLERKVELSLHFYADELLVLSARGGVVGKPVLLGTKIGGTSRGPDALPRVTRLDELPKHYEARLDVNLAQIARNILRSGLL